MKHLSHFAFFTLLAAFALVTARPQNLQAQTSGFVFHPSEDQPAPVPMAGAWQSHPIGARNYWGFEAGINSCFLQNANNFAYSITAPATATGSFIDGQAAFADPGKGFGFILGGVGDLALSRSLALQAKLRFVNSSFTGDDTRTVASSSTGLLARFVAHNHTSMSYVGLDALLRLQLSPNSLYLLGGMGFSTIVANNLDLTLRIDSAAPSTSFTDRNGAITGQTSLTSSNAITNAYNTSRVAIRFGVGTFVPLGNAGSVLTPELTLDIPLTDLYNQTTNDALASQKATAPRLWHADFTIGYKFPWGSADASNPGISSNDNSNTDNNSGDRNADNMVVLKGKVNDKNGNPVDANMTVVDLSDNSIVTTGKSEDGQYSLPVKGPGKYSVTADADGYLFGTAYFEVDDQGRILKGKHDISLSPSADGRTRLLVFFDFAKDQLQNASYPELDRAVRLMKANPGMSVEIAGYTDSKGTDAYNVDLSNRRAQAVRNYLVRNGIESSRVSPKGYGKQDPIASNDTEDGRAENRRVEFVVMHR